jgi:hypothetical protein
MAKKNPTITTSSANLKPVMPGIDNLPNPIGKNMSVQEEGNAMPDVSMKENDGDNPSFSSPAFANGRDVRSYGSSPKSNPTPDMPGA